MQPSVLKLGFSRWYQLIPKSVGVRKYSALSANGADRLVTMAGAINEALAVALRKNEKSYLFGDDVVSGGLFGCSANLNRDFGTERVFDVPNCPEGIVGFGVGLAAAGAVAIAEIQFADSLPAAAQQIINEAAKYRYRSGGEFNCGGLTLRAAAGGTGCGGLYYSQSPEALFCHGTAGLTIAIPRNPYQAKGLLLAMINDPNPGIFLEPRALYKTAKEKVPESPYEIPLGTAEIVRRGTDVTLVSWGLQVHRCMKAADRCLAEYGISVEVIDLRSLQPWDFEKVIESATRTGRLIVSHEAPLTMGFGAEIAAVVQENCWGALKAPVMRVAGIDVPIGSQFEQFIRPAEHRLVDEIKHLLKPPLHNTGHGVLQSKFEKQHLLNFAAVGEIPPTDHVH